MILHSCQHPVLQFKKRQSIKTDEIELMMTESSSEDLALSWNAKDGWEEKEFVLYRTLVQAEGCLKNITDLWKLIAKLLGL